MKWQQTLISVLAQKAHVLGRLNFLKLISEKDYLALRRNRFAKLSAATKHLLDLVHNRFAEFEVTSPRICAACAENQMHYEEFQSEDVAICAAHNLLLEDHCPECHKTLVFDANLFRGICPNLHCLSRLPKEAPTREMQGLSTAQTKDCIRTGQIVAVIKAGDITSKFSDHYKLAFINGFETLTSQSAFNDLLSDLYHCLGGYAIPIGFFEKTAAELFDGVNLAQWPISLKAMNDIQISERLTSAEVTSTKYTTFGAFYKHMRITKDTATTLMQHGLIEFPGGKNVKKKSTINYSPFLNALSSHPIEDDEGLTNIFEFNLKHPGFNATIDDVLMAWAQNKLSISYQPKACLETSLKFKPQALKDVYLKNNLQSTSDLVELHDACKILKMPSSHLELLLKNDALSMKLDKHGRRTLLRAEVMAYLSSKLSNQQSFQF